MSEQTNKAGARPGDGASGQNVPKSKFHQKSQQERIAASIIRMEKQGEKLNAAREKLAKQKTPKKPGPIKHGARAVGQGVHGFVHGKIYENEHENVGIEGAHRSELVGEAVLRRGTRYVKKSIRTAPARAVLKAEAKSIRATVDYQYRAAAQEHPELNKKSISRLWQKQRKKGSTQNRCRRRQSKAQKPPRKQR